MMTRSPDLDQCPNNPEHIGLVLSNLEGDLGVAGVTYIEVVLSINCDLTSSHKYLIIIIIRPHKLNC